jgi:HK97 family phage portal protein
MAFWNRKSMAEQVADELEKRMAVPLTDAEAVKGAFPSIFEPSATGVHVNSAKAMSVSAVWAAVNFISGTLAGLPLHVYRKTESGRERVNGGLETILHDAPSAVDGNEWSSFAWRQYIFGQTLTEGRSYTFIERNAMGRVINLIPLETDHMLVERVGGRKRYRYEDGARTVFYQSKEIIDIPFMLCTDQIGHYGPIERLKNAIGLAIAIEDYASRFFQNGGVPPLKLSSPFKSPGAVERASEDIWTAIKEALRKKQNVLTMPLGSDIGPIGYEPEKGQMVDARRFQIEEIARAYSLPPVFLQDLTHGTFSNTEQQDLHFVKHTLKRWIEHFEQELNLKLFGGRNASQYVEMDVDGLLRGDFKTRMEGYAIGIQNALITPNEARAKENRPDVPNGDDLLIQSATVPLGSQPIQPAEQPTDEPETDTNEQ